MKCKESKAVAMAAFSLMQRWVTQLVLYITVIVLETECSVFFVIINIIIIGHTIVLLVV